MSPSLLPITTRSLLVPALLSVLPGSPGAQDPPRSASPRDTRAIPGVVPSAVVRTGNTAFVGRAGDHRVDAIDLADPDALDLLGTFVVPAPNDGACGALSPPRPRSSAAASCS